MSKTIHADKIGPFFESGRLRGTPEDDGYREPEDDRRRCWGCLRWYTADELAVIDGEMVCAACEERIEDAEAERRAGDEGRARCATGRGGWKRSPTGRSGIATGRTKQTRGGTKNDREAQ